MTTLRVVNDREQYALAADDESRVVDANRFLAAISARGLSPRTQRAYAFDLLFLYRWLAEAARPLLELRAADLVDLISAQQRAEASPRSINRRLSTTRLLFRFITDREVDHGPGILRPATHYQGPGRDHALGLHRLRSRVRNVRVKEPRLLIEPLTAEQVRAFLRTLTRYRDIAIVHLMLLGGLRSREILELDVSDLIWSDRRLRVRGKGGRDRMLPLGGVLERVLRDYLRVERPDRSSQPRLFLVHKGPRRGLAMSVAGLRSLFRHRRRRPSLATANAHRFRHTFGTDMARAGVTLPTLQRLMGHADMKTTLQYIELSLSDVAESYGKALASIEGRYRRKLPIP